MERDECGGMRAGRGEGEEGNVAFVPRFYGLAKVIDIPLSSLGSRRIARNSMQHTRRAEGGDEGRPGI